MKVDYAVVDTNVLISHAIKPDGTAGLVANWLIRNSQLVFSRETFAEFETRLWRPKFDRYITMDRRKRILNEMVMTSVWVDIAGELKLSRDPDDDKFIETALAASAQVLVSGDSDLLDVRLENLEILTPRQFAEKYIDAGQYLIHETSGEHTVKAGLT